MENVRVRVFSAIKDYQIEGQINGWLQELGNSIEIIQVLQSVVDSSNIVVTIFYREKWIKNNKGLG